MDSISCSALRLASELGHRIVGEEHLLVSWLEADLRQEQRHALDALGLTGDRGRTALVVTTGNENKRDPESGTQSGPTYHRASGRGHGLALAAGRALPSSDDVIRACLLEEGPASRLLDSMGIDRSDVVTGIGGALDSPPSDSLTRPAMQEAIALNGTCVGSWHVVLALLGGQPDGLAGSAFRACGITHDAYATWVTAWLDSTEPRVKRLAPGSSPEMSMAGHEILGRAEGLAVSDASSVVLSSHGALAWLWQDDGNAVSELEICGTTAPALLEALAERGVEIPQVPLTEPDRRPWGDSVYFPADRRKDVLARLHAVLTPGDWGWNCRGDEFWVDAIAEVDLWALVADVLSSEGT